MLVDFKVKNFMSIRSKLTLSFVASNDGRMASENITTMPDGTHLLKAATIYGGNATGKSNITKAIDYFQRLLTVLPTDTGMPLQYKPFAFDTATLGMATKMSATFYVGGTRFVMTIVYVESMVMEEMLSGYFTSRPATLYHRKLNRCGKPSIDFGSKSGLTKNLQDMVWARTFDNCTVLAALGNSLIGKCLLRDIFDYFAGGYHGLFTSVAKLKDYTRNILAVDSSSITKGFLEEMLRATNFERDISIVRTNGVCEMRFGQERNGLRLELGEQDESKGILRFIGLSALLYKQMTTSDSLVMIDGLDKELHPILRAYFFQKFLEYSRRSSQFLFTTHSFYLLDRDYIRRDIVWFSELDKDGGTKVRRLSKMGVRKTKSIYKAYREGKLCAHPDLTRYEPDLKEFGLDTEDEY